MVPALLSDIEFSMASGRMLPINLTFYSVVLLVAPIFEKREIVGAYAVFALLNTVVGLIASAPAAYFVFELVLSAAAAALAYLIQYNYIRMISSLSSEAKTDGLTGVSNRRAGFQKAEMVFELCRRHKWMMMVCMVDIDSFKEYNDCFGHQAGDKVLKKVAETIGSVFARSSDVVCRYGGEEFLVGASISDEKMADMLAENMRSDVEKLGITTSAGNVLTISAGYTVYTSERDGTEFTFINAITRADHALYVAKAAGRNRTAKQ